MNVIRKDATITNTDEDFPGAFEVVLSTAAKDRDGDELSAEDWKTPLPDKITFDTDHGMSVNSTVGSGTPSIEDGKMIVRGTYSSLPRAQEVRTLVKEGHIDRTSVAFMSEKVTKDGKSRTVRELLNGAFVAIPANREAVVLASKSVDAKAGARNSKTDAERIQAIHDHALALGATPADDTGAADGATGGKSLRRMVAAKAVDGSYEQREQAISDALHAQYPGDDMWAYTLATFDDSIVYRVSGASPQLQGQWQADYTYDNGVATIGTPTKVNLVEQVVPMKAYTKDYQPEDTVTGLADAVDAALDEAKTLTAGIDTATLPEPIQRALSLFAVTEKAVDALLDALDIPDPTEDKKPAPVAAEKAAPAAETEALDLQHRAIQLAALAG